MIQELEYVAYFENLASQSKDFNHVPDVKDAFFYLPEPWDLTEIDNKLRSSKSVPLMLLDSMAGVINDETSQNHVQTINGQFTVLDIATLGDAKAIRATRDKCLGIGLNVLARMRIDYRKKQLINSQVFFSIGNVPYDPVGPMYQKHYGYTFRFKITCPFGFTVDSTIWRDIPPA